MKMMKAVYTFLLAGTLVVPHVFTARADDATTQPGAVQQDQIQVQSDRQLQLPAVPNLESMPWLKSLLTSKGTKIDLLDPQFQVPTLFPSEQMISQASGSAFASFFASTVAGAAVAAD
jgi:hypothetical protein